MLWEKYVLGEGRKKNEKATKMKKEIEVYIGY